MEERILSYGKQKIFKDQKIVAVVKSKIVELSHDEVLLPMEQLYSHKKSLTALCDRLTQMTR